MRYLDLTQTFAEPMPVYSGDPPPRLVVSGELEGCPMFEVTTGMHVGTHMDAPLHFIPGGATIAEVPVERFTGHGVLIDARGRDEIGEVLLSGVVLKKGDVVLVWTGFSARFREAAYFAEFPSVTEEFAKALVAAEVNLLGLDTPSPDNAPPYSAHKVLLGNGVLIVENLTNLERLAGVGEFEVIALPVKFQSEAAPARVVARVSGLRHPV